MSYRKIIVKLEFLFSYIWNLVRRKKMKLYKFRSLENFEYTADIILNDRLYAADFETMNDVMEGIFWHEGIDKDILTEIKNTKKKLKICSMSKEEAFSNPLMWAHYADSFKGVCLEFEVDKSKVDAQEIVYDDGALKLTLHQNETNINDTWAKVLLCKKYSDWEYEKEYRIFSEDKYINDGVELKKIYLGVCISKINENLLFELVQNRNIDIIKTDFDGEGRVVREGE